MVTICDKNFPIRPLRLLLCAILLAHMTSATFSDNRTIDGSNNNLDPNNTLQGAAQKKFSRFQYGTKFGDVVGDQLASGLPNPRSVSNAISTQTVSKPNIRQLSDWAAQWGQFLTHDLMLTPSGGNGNILSDSSMGSFLIPILDPNDPFFPTPILFNRSNYDPNTGLLGPPIVPREQMNDVTSYLDASNVYGSDDIRAAALRDANGKLKTSANGQLLPYNTSMQTNQNPFGYPDTSLFLAGDVRANEQVGLTVAHTVFMREHNRLATLLDNGSRTTDEIYELTRKIVGAEVQAITYNEFLPALLGSTAPRAEDYVYDSAIDATITNSFATAFFRIGHSMQSPEIKLVNNSGQEMGSLAVRDAFFDPNFLGNTPSNLELVLKGLASQVAQENDTQVVDELRNFLFVIPNGPSMAFGLDLIALDIQRGRDHGLPGFNSLRLSYGLNPTTIQQMSIDPNTVQTLTTLYGTANKVDAFIGGLAEDHLTGSSVGELINAALVSQFTRLRDGDRFFYTGDPDLQQEDVTAIINFDDVTLANVIRWNTNIISKKLLATPTLYEVSRFKSRSHPINDY